MLDSDFDRIVTLLDLFFSFSSLARSENILLGHSNGERASEHSLILAIYTRTAGVYWLLGGGFLAIFWLYSRSREEMGMGEKFRRALRRYMQRIRTFSTHQLHSHTPYVTYESSVTGKNKRLSYMQSVRLQRDRLTTTYLDDLN